MSPPVPKALIALAIFLWLFDALLRKLKGEPFLSDTGETMEPDNRNFIQRLIDHIKHWFRGTFGTGTKL